MLTENGTQTGCNKPEPAVKTTAIRIKINSPAYMLPNSRKPSDTGLASSATVSSSRLGKKTRSFPGDAVGRKGLTGEFSDEAANAFNLDAEKEDQDKTVKAMPMVALTSVVGTTF